MHWGDYLKKIIAIEAVCTVLKVDLNKFKKEKSMAKAWTYVYRPFVMGGSTHVPVGFEFEDAEEIELGKGYTGYQLTSPNGKTIVVEKTSGAIVGSSVVDVQKDIAEADEAVMQRQVEKACEEAKRMEVVSEEEFWKIYKG